MRGFLMHLFDVPAPSNEPLNLVAIVIFLAVIMFLAVAFVAALVFVLILFKRRRMAQPSSPNQS